MLPTATAAPAEAERLKKERRSKSFSAEGFMVGIS
jgi:hypothetical protein